MIYMYILYIYIFDQIFFFIEILLSRFLKLSDFLLVIRMLFCIFDGFACKQYGFLYDMSMAAVIASIIWLKLLCNLTVLSERRK